jgi:hypothetical protein
MRRLGVVVLAACGGNAAVPDAPVDDPLPDAPLGAFSAPIPLTELNTADAEEDPSLPADQLEIFFTSNRLGGAGANDIWTATRASTSEPFGVATPITQINTAMGELHAQVSPDGLSMYFSSNRAGGLGAADIYFTTRASRSAPWTTPTLVVELSSAGADFVASPDVSGLHLVLGSNRTGNVDLFVSSRATTSSPWRGPTAIAQLNTIADEQDGMLADGGLALYFSQGDMTNPKELMVARRPTVDGVFGAPEPVTEVNSAMDELDPWVSDDERTIYFNSNRGGTEDLYFSSR